MTFKYFDTLNYFHDLMYEIPGCFSKSIDKVLKNPAEESYDGVMLALAA
jgi:hypothetical protein